TDTKVFAYEFLRSRPAADLEEIDDLYEQPGLALAGFPNCLDELAQSRKVAVVPDAQQGTARDIADPGSLDDDSAGFAAREPPVPGEELRGDITFVRSPPGDHCRHPGTLQQPDRSYVDRAEQPRSFSLFPAWPGARYGLVLNAFRGPPHRFVS